MNVFGFIKNTRDIIFDRRCAACDERLDPYGDSAGIEGRVFCGICEEAIMKHDGPKCSRCADPFVSASRDHLCPTCIKKPPIFEKVYSPYQYGGPLAQAILRMKYAPAPHLSRSLGMLMSEVPVPVSVDLVVPVPLHRRRLVKRGFNQASLLGWSVARQIGVGMDTNTLRRREDTTPQVGKDKRQRVKDMEGAFYLKAKPNVFRGRNILLVDDVVTTTGTVRAASKTLQGEGKAASVNILCLARAT